jgi:hypothetical protein
MDSSKLLKRRFFLALFALFIAFLAVLSATFAWYIYNTGAHTTSVRMAAGASASLEISGEADGTYGSATVLDSFAGTLNPVSTDSILGGFQKVYGFTSGSGEQASVVANLFGAVDESDYYKTTLYLRTSGSALDVYLTDIGFEDSSADAPISTAIRVGFVVGDTEAIFAINQAENPEAEYNTATGKAGYVLSASAGDGSTVEFTPYTSANFCAYDRETGVITRTDDSVALCTVAGDGNGDYGTPTQVDIYIWLEGCDPDCTNSLAATTLQNLALSFVGVAASDAE